jgi:hypothetical protein
MKVDVQGPRQDHYYHAERNSLPSRHPRFLVDLLRLLELIWFHIINEFIEREKGETGSIYADNARSGLVWQNPSKCHVQQQTARRSSSSTGWEYGNNHTKSAAQAS